MTSAQRGIVEEVVSVVLFCEPYSRHSSILVEEAHIRNKTAGVLGSNDFTLLTSLFIGIDTDVPTQAAGQMLCCLHAYLGSLFDA